MVVEPSVNSCEIINKKEIIWKILTRNVFHVIIALIQFEWCYFFVVFI